MVLRNFGVEAKNDWADHIPSLIHVLATCTLRESTFCHCFFWPTLNSQLVAISEVSSAMRSVASSWSRPTDAESTRQLGVTACQAASVAVKARAQARGISNSSGQNSIHEICVGGFNRGASQLILE